ncbi:SpoIIE family protein phosphatase [Mangrovihabitans endophyticus]|uniref:Transcriptional regulator n=1 Tax=Mangrovihabitans endophyticus TaxID=1751298 RepID=A0A8J3C2E1_9ACTN|nr:SpoIIE family protein phosphatase [Mangrovihabitans endophyticus]GGK97426.1 transcriptional regulator [Mangrovihabitans endophyticus]
MSGGAVASLPEGLLDGGVWFRMEEPGSASGARRAAERLAAELAVPERRIADLSIVVAELAGNLVKHAEHGRLFMRAVRTDDQAGVELVAVDTGPGMRDVAQALGDGHSTVGTLGIGLGAIMRQASWSDLHSVPDRGTVLAVQVWPGPPPTPAWAAGLVRPLTGEPVSGDGCAVREAAGRRQVMVCDGLGHGPLAARAAQEAARGFAAAPAAPPSVVVEALHRALGHTRGAAVAVAELDPAAGVVRYAGLGNVVGAVLAGGGARRGMVSLPGIAGHQRRQIREYEYALGPADVVVMHTDGVVDRWDPSDYPGLLTRSPQVIAATVLRDGGTRRDDAGVLVARL